MVSLVVIIIIYFFLGKRKEIMTVKILCCFLAFPILSSSSVSLALIALAACFAYWRCRADESAGHIHRGAVAALLQKVTEPTNKRVPNS